MLSRTAILLGFFPEIKTKIQSFHIILQEYFKNLELLSVLMFQKQKMFGRKFLKNKFSAEWNWMYVSRNSTQTFKSNVFKIIFLLRSKLLYVIAFKVWIKKWYDTDRVKWWKNICLYKFLHCWWKSMLIWKQLWWKT